MARFEDSIEVNVPVRAAYDQWTQFEEFPQFMSSVERVEQIDDKTLDWAASVAGQKKQWRAEITDQTPDRRVAWKSTSGDENAGAVLFDSLAPDRTKVTLMLDADPKGIVETIGANIGVLESQIKKDLERFKEFIESRRTPTGAWRGEIHGDEVRDGKEVGSR
ncbi:MAG: SRPBCC family protein [Chloroflexi bacterium]|nr:SRPBCC family protein [Chloroflexota bacterium]